MTDKSDRAAETTKAVDAVLFNLWEAVNQLAAVRPEEESHYRVSIFGSARIKPGDALYEDVKSLARQLAELKVDIVTGGGPGLMQAANEGENEGNPNNETRSIGITIDLPFEDKANPFVEKLYTHKTFFTRLHQFVRMSSAFIVVGGGIGTSLEAFMIWQLMQVEHKRKVPFIFVGEMWRELVKWAREQMLAHDPPLASPEDFELPQCVQSVHQAVALIRDDLEEQGRLI